MLTVCCAAASWLVMQVTGILAYGELLPERSLQTAAAMVAGAAASLLMKNGKKRGEETRRVHGADAGEHKRNLHFKALLLLKREKVA